MNFGDLDKAIFYTVTIYLDVDELKILEKTNKKYQKLIRDNSRIENRILKYNYNLAKIQLKTFKESPLLSCIDFLDQKKIENGDVVNRFKDKKKLYEYVKNKFYFQNYRFESLYNSQFRIFENNLKNNNLKNKNIKEKPLLLYKQTNKKNEKIQKIDKNTNYSYKNTGESIKKKNLIIIPHNTEISAEDFINLDTIQMVLNVQNTLKIIRKKYQEERKNLCPYLAIKNYISKT